VSLTSAQALPIISQYESSNSNVPNQMGPNGTPLSTASGYYQIINGTWQQFAPQVGVDLNQYPTAMSAPQAVQAQVAGAIYNAQGFSPWSSNTQLMNAVANYGTPSNTTGVTTPMSGSTGTSSTGTSSTVPSNYKAGTDWASVLLEMLTRGGVVIAGFGLLMVGLIFLLIQSKTVQTSGKALAELT
jgi:hypothetical protein